MSCNTRRSQTFPEDLARQNYFQIYQDFATSPIAQNQPWLPSYAHLSQGSFAFAPNSCFAFQGCAQSAILYPGSNIYRDSLPMVNISPLQYPQYQTNYHYESPCPPINGNVCGQQPYHFNNQPLFPPSACTDLVAGQTVPFAQATRGSHFNNRAQVLPSLWTNEEGGFQGFYFSNRFYGRTANGTSGLTLYAVEKRITLQFSKVPGDGDIFCCRQVGNVLILEFVAKENPEENHSLLSSENPRDRSLYRVHEGNGGFLLLMVGADNKLSFPEESRTFTYCLLDKGIMLNFNRLPKDGDVFCSEWMNRVMRLNFLAEKDSQELHNLHYSGYPGDLYCVREGNDGLLLSKIDKNEVSSEIIYSFGGTTHDKNRYFTYYLPNIEMAFHFERLPADGDIVCSQLSNNVMALDRFPPENDQDRLNLQSGNPRKRNFYRVKRGDAGFVLVKIAYSNIPLTYQDVMRLQLKLRVCIGSSSNLDEDDHLCAVCLDAYENDDIVVGLGCGHEYHPNCIMTSLQQKGSCPICYKGVSAPPPRSSNDLMQWIKLGGLKLI